MWYSIDFSRLPEVNMVGRINYSGEWNIKGRISHSDRFIFLLKGEATYEIDNKIFNITSGDCLYIPLGAFYKSYTQTECEFYFIHFIAEKVLGPVGDDEAEKIILKLKEREDKKEQLPHYALQKTYYDGVYYKQCLSLGKHLDDAAFMLSKCENNRYIQYPNNKLYVDVRFAQIVLMLNRISVESVLPVSEVSSTLLKITQYIQQYYNTQITLTHLTQHFGLSKQYIIRLFNKYLNTTVTKYINTLRLEHSLELLKHSTMNINEIAAHLGFNSAYYFCRLFKANYYMTPTEYIKSDMASD